MQTYKELGINVHIWDHLGLELGNLDQVVVVQDGGEYLTEIGGHTTAWLNMSQVWTEI